MRRRSKLFTRQVPHLHHGPTQPQLQGALEYLRRNPVCLTVSVVEKTLDLRENAVQYAPRPVVLAQALSFLPYFDSCQPDLMSNTPSPSRLRILMLVPSRPLLQYLRYACSRDFCPLYTSNGRAFATTTAFASGHSKWATIKHDKARVDARKNKQRSMLAQQIELTSKLYGADPESSPRLKTVIAEAKRQGLPRDTLEAAIKRGQGLSTSGRPLEHVTIEAVFPSGVAAIIECQTESKAKTLMEVRTILTKHSGSQSPVQFLFKRRGVIVLKTPLPNGVTVDAVMECALEVEGFEDIEEEDGMVELASEPNATKAVADALIQTLGVDVESLEILWQATDLVDAPPDDIALIEAAVDKIEDITEVQDIYLNMRKD